MKATHTPPDDCCTARVELEELRQQKAAARDGHLRQLTELRADIADVRSKNHELVTQNAVLMAALERLIEDNERRGLTSSRLSWARRTLASVRGDA